MPIDCINSQSKNGRNATPLPIVEMARDVLGWIDLDPASDAVINRDVKATRYFTRHTDGFSMDWHSPSIWLNPPGKTLSQGKQVTATDWFRKLYHHWKEGDVEEAIALVYRAGSIGSLGMDILSLPLCLTSQGGQHVNGSGRLSFDLIVGESRRSQTSNTQSSVIILFAREPETLDRFSEVFGRVGVVKT